MCASIYAHVSVHIHEKGAEPYSVRESVCAFHSLKHVCTKSTSFLLGMLTACFT